MSTSVLSICILSLAFISFARAEIEPPTQKRFSGAKAHEEIQAFMTSRWHRQVWQIECKPIEGLADSSPTWHIKGTQWWVRLEGPEHLRGSLSLKALDPTQVYEFAGIPVDHNYGVITFYLLSKPKGMTAPDDKKDAEQDGAGQPATRSESK